MDGTTTKQHLWWHLYGALSDDGLWMQSIIGGSAVRPETTEVQDLQPANIEPDRPRQVYLASFDHEPTDADLDHYRPVGHRSWEQ